MYELQVEILIYMYDFVNQRLPDPLLDLYIYHGKNMVDCMYISQCNVYTTRLKYLSIYLSIFPVDIVKALYLELVLAYLVEESYDVFFSL